MIELIKFNLDILLLCGQSNIEIFNIELKKLLKHNQNTVGHITMAINNLNNCKFYTVSDAINDKQIYKNTKKKKKLIFCIFQIYQLKISFDKYSQSIMEEDNKEWHTVTKNGKKKKIIIIRKDILLLFYMIK